MWEHPCTDCICPALLVGELDLTWTKVTSFLRVWGSSHLGREWSWKWWGKAGARCEAGLLFSSMAITTLSGTGSDPNLLEQKP